MTFAEQMSNYVRSLEKSPEEQIDDRKQKHLKAGKSMAEAERLAKWELDLAAMIAEDDLSPGSELEESL